MKLTIWTLHGPLSNYPILKSLSPNIHELHVINPIDSLTWVKVVRRDMVACNLTTGMTLNRFEWQNRIRVADPK